MAKKKTGYFTNHAKSSAALVSLGIHAALVVIALSFVAVTVIQKEDNQFEAKPVNRPKMQLKKLQVPVNIKKKQTQKPKLRKRIVVQPKVQQNMPDIKMPEITGVKGGLGNAGGTGLGGGGGLGFTMPEINVFGVKGKGEKVFIMLDASDEMMYDEMGGIPAYTIIKDELVKIIDGLPATALFNVCVFDKWNTYLLFPKLVPANSVSVAKVDEWLKPLNAVKPGMGINEWGTRTLGSGGMQNQSDLQTGSFQGMESWHRPAMLSMEQQSDAVFLLTSWWGYQRYAKTERDQGWFETSAGQRFLQKYDEALKVYDDECKKRVANGDAPRVLNRNDKRLMVVTYFEGTPLPPEPEFFYYKPDEYIKGMLEIRSRSGQNDVQTSSGIRRNKNSKSEFTFNVIRFIRTGEERTEWRDGRSVDSFKKMTGYFNGAYRELEGLEAIKSSISSN
ncbi:hypothetical protein PDESU_01367 [Pontiella desulfatans]|uniref:VWFA domain-containing protein n=1 Tax=Pontiella desulfatans TaxID=2750659 RepID=A0A6C2TYX5_PONDE|nr:hypothetical protein [Pontiella desulfatans]VGO12813.1 hypothetical protein PDESU_01367 [Pontiella desulfatans]